MRKRELTRAELRRCHCAEFEGISLTRQAARLKTDPGRLYKAMAEYRRANGLRAPEPVRAEQKRLAGKANPEFYGKGYGRRPRCD